MNQDIALAAFFSDIFAGNSVDVSLFDDNARSHQNCDRRSEFKSMKDQNRICRWRSCPCEEEETLVVEELQTASSVNKPARKSRRSRINQAENLNQDRFCFGGVTASRTSSPKQSSPKKPKRQVTPDVNYDIEKKLGLKQPQRLSNIAEEGLKPSTGKQRHMMLRKPIRQLTPPNVEAKATRRGSPTNALVPEKSQFIRQGSLD